MEILFHFNLAPFFIVISVLSLILFLSYIFSILKFHPDLYKEFVPPADVEDFKLFAKKLQKRGDKKR